LKSPKEKIFVSSVDSGNTELTADTYFRFASNTKNFTATAILNMYEDGWLDYKAKIKDTIPGSKMTYVPATVEWNIPFKNEITIEQLLQHSAGVFDVDNDSNL
jgi:D-alanyl-D-alanine carboxypeptidase